MQVKSKAKLVDGLDDHLGSYAIAVPSIRQGYRYSFDVLKGIVSRDFFKKITFNKSLRKVANSWVSNIGIREVLICKMKKTRSNNFFAALTL
jgi:hypothetical protein